MNKVLRISLDIKVSTSCSGDELAEEVMEELNRRGFEVLWAYSENDEDEEG